MGSVAFATPFQASDHFVDVHSDSAGNGDMGLKTGRIELAGQPVDDSFEDIAHLAFRFQP
jgi:hypothetical protein